MPIDLPPGLALARAYDEQVVRPLLARHAPGLEHAAARLGSGSDVLGVDDEQSRDHDWGLRLTLLVEDGRAEEIDALLERELPRTWNGLPTRFATTWDPVVRQRVEVASATDFAASRLGVDAARLATAATCGGRDATAPSDGSAPSDDPAPAEVLAAVQGEQGLPTLSPATEPFFERPHIGVRGLPELLTEQIRAPEVRALPLGVGTAEQISDNVTVLVDPAARRRLVGP